MNIGRPTHVVFVGSHRGRWRQRRESSSRAGQNFRVIWRRNRGSNGGGHGAGAGAGAVGGGWNAAAPAQVADGVSSCGAVGEYGSDFIQPAAGGALSVCSWSLRALFFLF